VEVGIRQGALLERLRSSLFFVPMLFVALFAALGLVMTEVDSLFDGATELPFVLTSTVDSARELLSVVAGATVTVAGIAFSVSLLVIQQASSQLSPRVVHSLFRDPFNRRVMGLAVGTFTYCLMVLRAVRGPLEEGGEPVIPNLSVGVAVVLGVAAILAIVAFIDHNAHSLEVSQILARVTDGTVDQIRRTWPERGGAEHDLAGADRLPPGPGHCILFATSGWLQQLSTEGLLDLVPDGGTVRLDTTVGRYAVEGTPLCTVWPVPEDLEAAAVHADGAIQTGAVRTMQQDPSYGIRQLADVALTALSPGVNDPTTAQEAIFHLAAVLREALVRDLPPRVEEDGRGRRLLRPEDHTQETLVELAFDEIRRTAASLPTVCTYVLEALHLLHDAVLDVGRPELAAHLRRQADLVLAGAEHADLLAADRDVVRAAHERRFGEPGPAPT
jgi:uncharacterized membrane protein